MNRNHALLAAAALGLAAVSGGTGWVLANREAGNAAADASGRKVLYWYDPMVPQEHYPGPGKSSMNMDLVPKYADEGAGGGGITVSPAMMQNLGVRLARVEVRDVGTSVRAVGRVEFDERLVSEVQTLTPGFVEKLAVRAEGEPVSAGRLIATVYSPDLLTAQNEYKALLRMPGITSRSLRQASRSRLGLLGLPEGFIRRLERGGAPQRTYPVVSPSSGIVTKIGARSGAQVTPGQSIVTIGGLSRVLVIAEVPEASLGAARIGQPVEIAFPAYGGEIRKGVVDYIYPSLNAEARTARVRVTLPNPGGRLKAGMFANVTLQGAGGMALVVPSEAIIDTGRRRVVIVRRSGAFVPVEVAIGRDLADWTEIQSGLRAGEEVVASGQFLIDSEASLSGVVARLTAAAPSAQAAAPRLISSRGLVQSIETAGSRITIRHEAVPAIGWPARVTAFSVSSAAMLRGLRRGEPVEFSFGGTPRGNSFVIDSIRQDPRK